MTTDDSVVSNSFAAKLAAAQKRLGVTPSAVPAATPQAPASTAPAGPNPSVPDEDIPELEFNISPEDKALDDAIKNLSILEAYDKWCGKMKPRVGAGQRESIKISCPNPSHPDNDPSAWINLDKNVYYCPGCAYGGDVFDIAALAYGFPVPGYKHDPPSFRKLREMIGLELGFSIVKGLQGTYVVSPGSGEEDTAEAPSTSTAASAVEVSAPTQEDAPTQELPAQATPVGKLPSAVEAEQREQDYLASLKAPRIDWRELVPEHTFLRAWMEATTQDNSPEEFHLWTGLMALGFALGRKKVLWDEPAVVGNLFVCLVGPSGAGKSRSSRHLVRVLDMAMRWDPSTHTGVKGIKQPGSAEYLVSAFTDTEEDPSNPGNTIEHPVRGLVEFPELSTLISVGGRAGSALKPQLMDIYDAAPVISSGSLTHGTRTAREPYGQCLSTTQNSSLSRLLDKGDEDSGFMNRWVFAQGPLKPPVALGGVRVDLTHPAQMLSAVYTWTYTGPSEVQWSDQAVELWTDFFMNTLHPVKEQSEKNGSSMLNRMDLLLKKLILLFTANIMSNVVPKAAVEQAIALYPYLLKTFGVVSSQLHKAEDADQIEKVLGCIQRLSAANGQGPTRREIYSSVRATFKSTEQLKKLLTTMVDMEILKEVIPARKPGQRGQLGVRYAIAN